MSKVFDDDLVNEITPRKVYLNRRDFLQKAIALGAIAASASDFTAAASPDLTSEITDFKKVSRYNNYYEFSQNKDVIHQLAKDFTTSPWTLTFSGLIDHPGTLDLKELPSAETFTYRFRCVEGWSMVVPWQGIRLKDLLAPLKPKPEAKFVKFTSVYRPSEMIGQRRSVMAWPYTEALRIDEAMHPLTVLATGMYGKPLPNQNGAPVRLVVPWKYGFKSIKAIEKIEFVSEQPETSWGKLSPGEYGFYANVNPKVAHPRWSQRRELRLGESKKRKTLMYNGYEKEVAYLYKGMDLTRYF